MDSEKKSEELHMGKGTSQRSLSGECHPDEYNKNGFKSFWVILFKIQVGERVSSGSIMTYLSSPLPEEDKVPRMAALPGL